MPLPALKTQLAAVVSGTPSSSPGLPTGLRDLDRIIPAGLPRGRITELLGEPGSGKTTIARAIAQATAKAGRWVACVDATRTLDPRDWASLSSYEGVWIIRPGDPTRAAWSADVLLRSGAFALVIIDGAAPLSRATAVRLTQLARESDAAILILSDAPRGADISSALRLRVEGRALARTITLEKGGPWQRAPLEIPRGLVPTRRLGAHPEIPDRRGAARTRGQPRIGSVRGRRAAQPRYPAARKR